MNSKSFKANSWLNISKPKDEPTHVGPSYSGISHALNLDEKSFSPQSFLTQGWKGEGLSSKEFLKIKKLVYKLWEDSKVQFKSLYSRNRTIKYGIYTEFLAYANERSVDCPEVESFADFWEAVVADDSEQHPDLKEFVNIYCFRVLAIYLYKVRFLSALSEQIYLNPSASNYLNPSSFFNKIFKKGSSTELNCDAVQSNIYSWYRPTSELKEEVINLVKAIPEVSQDEIISLSNYDLFTNKKTKASCEDMSHSMSHESFGLFVNDLIIKFPVWLKKETYIANKLENANVLPEIVNTKFVGNNLESLAFSHWLAQGQRATHRWNDLICPDFINNDFSSGIFLKLCQEFQFMTYVLSLASIHDHSPLELLCKIMNEKYKKNSEDEFGQMSMFSRAEQKNELTYDRVVLNLSTLPKKNPHHYLVGQIQDQLKILSKKGIILLFTNQRLFVPSQSDRVEQLLEKAQIKANFSLENLKGKGEIPNYLYVLTKRTERESAQRKSGIDKTSPFYISTQRQKEACLSLRWNGELSSFQKFQQVVDDLNKFFSQKSSVSTPLFQQEIDPSITFHFHQDAILEGKLLSSSTKDNKITHPNFFNNLTKSCIQLGQLFNIESLDTEEKKKATSDLLGINIRMEEKFPIVLVVDHTNPKSITIELIPSNSYKAKVQECGIAFFQYFGLFPKVKEINLNIIREFFNTAIGRQIIQLSLNGGFTKVKSKLRELLIPKFFSAPNLMPSHLQNGLALLSLDANELKAKHPQDIFNEFENLESIISNLGQNFPWHMSILVTQFKNNLESVFKCLDKGESVTTNIDYSNPMILESLVKLPTKKVYPFHDDIYIKFEAHNPQDIHLPYTHTNVKNQDDQHIVEIYSGDTLVISLYLTKQLSSFVRFILKSAEGLAISQLLQSLEVPHSKDLEEVVESYLVITQNFKQISHKVDFLLTRILTSQISIQS